MEVSNCPSILATGQLGRLARLNRKQDHTIRFDMSHPVDASAYEKDGTTEPEEVYAGQKGYIGTTAYYWRTKMSFLISH